jgi:serine/threonine protein kinase
VREAVVAWTTTTVAAMDVGGADVVVGPHDCVATTCEGYQVLVGLGRSKALHTSTQTDIFLCRRSGGAGAGAGGAAGAWDLVAKVARSPATNMEAELHWTKTLDHAHIVRLVAATHVAGCVCLVLPRYAMDGFAAVEQAVQEGRQGPAGGLVENEARPLFRALVSALGHLHGLNLAHRDVKPENVLVGRDGSVVLGDLGGVTAAATTGVGGVPASCKGTRFFQAPEMVDAHVASGAWVRMYKRWQPRGAPRGPLPAPCTPAALDDKALDTWAAGSTLFAWLTFTFLVIGETGQPPEEYFAANPRGGGLRVWSPQLVDLLTGMLRVDPTRRLAMEQVLVHPWVTHGT